MMLLGWKNDNFTMDGPKPLLYYYVALKCRGGAVNKINAFRRAELEPI